MTAPPPRGGRRFDDEEVSLILRRAAELQETEPGAGSQGMTLADLEEVAREAGLDPSLVRRAAAEVGDAGGAGGSAHAAPLSGGSRFLGAPTVLRTERIVDGELAVDEFETLLDEIRRTFNDVGSFSTLGRTLAWRSSPGMQGRHGGGGRQINVTVVVRGGQTGIRVEETTGQLAGGLFGGLMGGIGGGGSGIAVGIGLAAMHSVPAAVGIWGALLGTSYALARTIFVAMSRRRAAALGGLADRLAEYVQGAVTPAGPRRLGAPPPPRPGEP
jgi:hypothetical protein